MNPFPFGLLVIYKRARGGYVVKFEEKVLLTFLKRGRYWRFARKDVLL